jgi:hypothetical protein
MVPTPINLRHKSRRSRNFPVTLETSIGMDLVSRDRAMPWYINAQQLLLLGDYQDAFETEMIRLRRRKLTIRLAIIY